MAGGLAQPREEANLPVTTATQFLICSITKSFTATGMALLHNEGRLDWTKPVRDYMPEFRLHDAVATERVTVRSRHRVCAVSRQATLRCRPRSDSVPTAIAPEKILLVASFLHDAHLVRGMLARQRYCIVWRAAQPGLEFFLACQQHRHALRKGRALGQGGQAEFAGGRRWGRAPVCSRTCSAAAWLPPGGLEMRKPT